jgi:hypothetical protein
MRQSAVSPGATSTETQGYLSPTSPMNDGTWVVGTPTSMRGRVPIMSPIPDISAERHLRVTLAVGTKTEELVATSLSKAIAAVRSGEVCSVPVKRVLHISRHDQPTVASNIKDLTPKKGTAPQANVLYF